MSATSGWARQAVLWLVIVGFAIAGLYLVALAVLVHHLGVSMAQFDGQAEPSPALPLVAGLLGLGCIMTALLMGRRRWIARTPRTG